jgi:hypothetical protein
MLAEKELLNKKYPEVKHVRKILYKNKQKLSLAITEFDIKSMFDKIIDAAKKGEEQIDFFYSDKCKLDIIKNILNENGYKFGLSGTGSTKYITINWGK